MSLNLSLCEDSGSLSSVFDHKQYNKPSSIFSATFVVATAAGLIILYSINDENIFTNRIITVSTEIERDIDSSYDEDSGLEGLRFLIS